MGVSFIIAINLSIFGFLYRYLIKCDVKLIKTEVALVSSPLLCRTHVGGA